MDRKPFTPAFIAANEKVLEAEAAKQGPTNPTTTIAPTTPTTTVQAGTTTETTQGTSTTTTTAGTTTPTTQGTSTTTTTAQQQQQQQPEPQVSDEMLLKRMRELTKNPNLSMEEVLSAYNKAPELTEEQKKVADQNLKIKVQSAFVNAGKGTIDDYHRITQLPNIKDADLVMTYFMKDAREMDPSLTDEELEELFNAHYFISDNPNMYTEPEMKLGQRRLASDAKGIRQMEAKPLTEVENDLKIQEEAIAEAGKWEQRANNFIEKMPKTFTVPIGKIGEKEMGDFIYPLSEAEQRDLADSIRDPAFLIKQIRDPQTGKTDLSKLYDLVLAKRILHTVIRAAASDHYSQGVDSVTSVLHNYPDLRHSGDTRETPDQTKERLEGEAQIRKDANNTFGRGPRVKSL